MFKLFPSTEIPKHDDDKGWNKVTRELKRIENAWFKYRANREKWEAEDKLKKEQNIQIRMHQAASDQEIRYLKWRQMCVSRPK